MEQITIREYISTPEGYRQFRDSIDEILINFNFDRVYRAMKALDWIWVASHGGVPNVQEIKRELLKHLKSIERLVPLDSVSWEMGIGGFEIRCYMDKVDEFEKDGEECDCCREDVLQIEVRFVIEPMTSNY